MVRLQERVLDIIHRHGLIKKGDNVVAALSGGPDSACLLHILFSLAGRLDFRVYAIHINHMLRGAESDADEQYAGELCQSLHIPFRPVRVDIGELSRNRRMSLEEAGREVRYEEFGKYADEIGAAAIAVAHNRNDQAETVLMHLLRGSGLDGLAGMEFRRGRIIRPLLDTDRREILDYCREQGLTPRTDSTNLKDDFTRNKIRLKLIPYIDENFDADITSALCRVSRLAGTDGDFLDGCARKEYEQAVAETGGDFVKLRLDALKSLHPALLGRVLRFAAGGLRGGLQGIESKHVEILADLVRRGRTGPAVQLPGGLRARRSYGLIKLFLEKSEDGAVRFSHEIPVPGHAFVAELDLTVAAEILEKPPAVDKYGRLEYNSMVQLFDYGLLTGGINIRNREAGDVFKPLGSNGAKKLKKFLIDAHVPREQRDQIPVIASGSEVVWLAGIKISDKFKVTENTKFILKLEICKN